MDELSLAVAKQHVRGVPGHIAEFGTMLGNTAMALAAGITLAEQSAASKVKSGNPTARNLHLFDSFEGLPASMTEVDIRSPSVMDGTWAAGTCKGLSPEELRAILKTRLPDERILIFEGWFEDTVPMVASETRYAVVHIDCDLYTSTMDVLDGLLGRNLLQPGALIYFDDWDCNAARPDLGERQAWADAVKKYNVEFSTSHSYAATGHAVIFHQCDSTRFGQSSDI